MLNKSVFPDDLDGLVREIVRELLTEALAAGELDIVDVIRRLPTRVVCALLGVARPDWDWLGRHDERRVRGPGRGVPLGQPRGDLPLLRRAADRSGARTRGRTSSAGSPPTAATRLDGERQLTDEEIIVNCNGVMAGGNETTRYSAAGGLLAFIENPDQWALLRERGAEVIPTAVEEILRWTTPGVHVMRTAMRPARDRRPGHQGRRPGDGVERVGQPGRARLPGRGPVPRSTARPTGTSTFGGGRHLCLGAKLARLELSIFLEELTKQVSAVELIGEPEYTASNFTWGCRYLPVRLTPTLVTAG